MAERRRKYREGEIDAQYFDKLPQRAKEIYFAYMGDRYFRCDCDSHMGYFHEVVGFNYDECKSSIEIIFNLAFDMVVFDELKHYLSLILQHEIVVGSNRYIADFVFDTEELGDEYIIFKRDYKLVIECDGHDFHEKTKEQVEYRNDRDMDLKNAGYDVIHFSGSQIFNNPIKCAIQTLKLIFKKTGGFQNGE